MSRSHSTLLNDELILQAVQTFLLTLQHKEKINFGITEIDAKGY
jgi:hypothetical protein